MKKNTNCRLEVTILLVVTLILAAAGGAHAQLSTVDDLYGVPFATSLVVEAPGVLSNDTFNGNPAEDAYVTDEDAALNVAAPGVLGNDSDADGDPITAGEAGALLTPSHPDKKPMNKSR